MCGACVVEQCLRQQYGPSACVAQRGKHNTKRKKEELQNMRVDFQQKDMTDVDWPAMVWNEGANTVLLTGT